MKFFYDHNINWHIAHAIQCLVENKHEHRIRAKQDLFRRVRQKKSVKDTEWLNRLGREGDWVAITKDSDILELEEEREAWQRAKTPLFYVPLSVEEPGFGHWNRIVWHIRMFPEIARFAKTADRQTAYRIPMTPSHEFEVIPLPSLRRARRARQGRRPVADAPLFKDGGASAG